MYNNDVINMEFTLLRCHLLCHMHLEVSGSGRKMGFWTMIVVNYIAITLHSYHIIYSARTN